MEKNNKRWRNNKFRLSELQVRNWKNLRCNIRILESDMCYMNSNEGLEFYYLWHESLLICFSNAVAEDLTALAEKPTEPVPVFEPLRGRSDLSG